jgi:hypothetical protein
MNWYLAKMVFRIVCGDGAHTPQFDEQLRLLHAEDEFHAFQKAQLLGEREQDNFLNAVHKPVHWKFIDVAEIHKLDEYNDGVEIYSKICEQDDANQYIHLIRLRAANILENSLQKSASLN